MDKENLYEINNIRISSLIDKIEQGKIAIPEIQRPFVWKKSQIRDLIDSLYKGYPVGYIITWESADAILKGKNSSHGKTILIDGQQRITAMRAAIVGETIKDKKYRDITVKIAFEPLEEKFETLTPAIEKNPRWIPDIKILMANNFDVLDFIDDFKEKFPEATKEEIRKINKNILRVRSIKDMSLGEIQLHHNIEIETVNEIFNRINKAGVSLSSADFAMSKIAIYEKFSGDNFGMNLRKTIDYFSELNLDKTGGVLSAIKENDSIFSNDKLSKIDWIHKEIQLKELYAMEYTDILTVASLAGFSRGDLKDLVSLLSGRNFEKRTYERQIQEESFEKLSQTITKITNQHNYKTFVQDVLLASGYINPKFIRSKNIVNYLYAFFLKLKDINEESTVISKNLRKLFIILNLNMSRLSSFNTISEADIRKINKPGDIENFVKLLENQLMGENFWKYILPQNLDKSSTSSQEWWAFTVSQRQLNMQSFLNKNIKINTLILDDIHHIFPKNHLKKHGMDQYKYNKIANFVFLNRETNISISDTEPKEYFSKIRDGYGNQFRSDINDELELLENMKQNAIPEMIFDSTFENYEEFLKQRTILMSNIIHEYYKSL